MPDLLEVNRACRPSLGAITRHVRTSHAVGRLVVDGFVARVFGWGGHASEAASSSRGESGPSAGAAEFGDESSVTNDLPLPEAEFALLTSAEVVDLVARCDAAAVRAIGIYEQAHRKRRLVIEAVAARAGL